MINRRSLITGLISLTAAPAIVRYGSLMPVKVMEPIIAWDLGLEEYTENHLFWMNDGRTTVYFSYPSEAIKSFEISDVDYYK